MPRYAFVVDSTPSFSEVLALIRNDSRLAADHREQLVAAHTDLIDPRWQSPRFADLTSAKTPYSADVIEGLGRTCTGGGQRLALIDMSTGWVMDRYDLRRRQHLREPALWAVVMTIEEKKDQYRLRDIKKWLAYHSHTQTLAQALTNDALAAYGAALKLDPSVQHPEELYIETRRALQWMQIRSAPPRVA